MPRTSGGREKVKRKGPKIDDALKERIFGAIRSGSEEIRPEGVTITEINAMAKTGHDRAFYATKALIEDQRVFLARCRIGGAGQKVNVYRTTKHLKLTEDTDPPDPEPHAVAKKKKKTKKPRVFSSAARIKLLRSRHKALLKKKKQRERRMDRTLGTQADTEDWSDKQ